MNCVIWTLMRAEVDGPDIVRSGGSGQRFLEPGRVDPGVAFARVAFERSDQCKTDFLVQGDGGGVWQCNSCDSQSDWLLLQQVKQGAVQVRPEAYALPKWVKLDAGFDSVIEGR